MIVVDMKGCLGMSITNSAHSVLCKIHFFIFLLSYFMILQYLFPVPDFYFFLVVFDIILSIFFMFLFTAYITPHMVSVFPTTIFTKTRDRFCFFANRTSFFCFLHKRNTSLFPFCNSILHHVTSTCFAIKSKSVFRFSVKSKIIRRFDCITLFTFLCFHVRYVIFKHNKSQGGFYVTVESKRVQE